MGIQVIVQSHDDSCYLLAGVVGRTLFLGQGLGLDTLRTGFVGTCKLIKWKQKNDKISNQK